jgi:lipopolysaccharide export LptBFGC system permease protein LptF
LSLATTLIFLTLIELSQAVGASGVIPPALAAWMPTVLFAILGGWLFVKART